MCMYACVQARLSRLEQGQRSYFRRRLRRWYACIVDIVCVLMYVCMYVCMYVGAPSAASSPVDVEVESEVEVFIFFATSEHGILMQGNMVVCMYV